ncbi:NAD-dependent epimerase/dehydratase family protein [Sediminitomix flava]|uniref:Uncharacterized protein YbjT (DUF2867 family) n=1 Tax=Sediminitomix flava TaxID=379075 RepID=A0A315ZBQ5_SEDFL|nr:NAD-dependent epimerase/dehydratase family protein [Sediminitomix flava]PWJ42589.1 uncharacterized protein YbjT (DUF2867 family) [Sediminitomix flava]
MEELKKTALVIGATGLVGKNLVQLLLHDAAYDKVIVFARRSTNIGHSKLQEHIVDFDHIESWKELLKGDVLFSAMGTTIKKAGSKDVQYKIDYTYQYDVAKAASEQGVNQYVLVSSSGANAKSPIFYARMKGELDEAVIKLNFEKVAIIRPSVLVGEREERRFGEMIGIKLGKVLSAILPPIAKYKPIRGETVAQAMINSLKVPTDKKLLVYELDSVFTLAKIHSV